MKYPDPQEKLRERAIWLPWHYETREDSSGEPYQTKVPDNPHDRPRSDTGDATDPDKRVTFEEIAAYAADYEDSIDGIGFAFPTDDLLCGVDLDDVVNESGEVREWAADVIDTLDSYTERSPSGDGFHIVVFGIKPGDRCKRKHDGGETEIECYDEGRFFTYTGEHVEGTPTEVNQRNDELSAVYNEYLADERESENGSENPDPVDVDLSDEKILEKAREAENGDKFRALERGDDSLHGGDTSAADQAFCNLLAFWTGGDRGRIDTLFRDSDRMRGKWDEARGDQTYGEITIDSALSSASDFYEPGGGPSSTPNPGGSSGGGGDSESESDVGEQPGRMPDWEGARSLMADSETKRALFNVASTLSMRYQPTRERDGDRADGYYYDGTTGMYKTGAANVLGDVVTAGLGEFYLPRHESHITKQAFGLSGSIESMPTREEDCLLFKNGVLDLEALLESDGDELPPAGEVVEEKTHEKRFTSRIPRRYDPEARCEEFDQLLERTMPDPVERERMLEHLAAGLIHGHVPKHFAVLVGPGDTGKTTLANILRGVLDADEDESNTETRSIHDLAGGDFGLAGLQKALIVTGSELGAGNKTDRGSAEVLKKLHGGEAEVDVEVKHENHSGEQIDASFLYVSNSLPYFSDADKQFYSRAIIAHAPNPVTEEEKDVQLADRIIKNESVGIVALLLRYARQYAQNGYQLTTPIDTETARDEWKKWSTSVNRFLERVCVDTPGTGSHAVRTTNLWEVYAEYCESEMVEPEDSDRFGSILLNKPVDRDRTRWPDEDGLKYVYHGFEFDDTVLEELGFESEPATSGMKSVGGYERVKTNLSSVSSESDGSSESNQARVSDGFESGNGMASDESGESGIDPTAKQAVARVVADVGQKTPLGSLKGQLGDRYDMPPAKAEKAIDKAASDGLVIKAPGNYIRPA